MNEQKKILQICAIDLSADALLKPLIKRSMEEGFVVHTACSDQGRFAALRSEGMVMIDVPIAREINPISNMKSVMALYKLMKREKYDIVHVHTPVAALLGRMAAKLAGIKNIVYTAHGFYFHEEMTKKQYSLFFNIEKYAARWMTDWLLLQSREDYDLALESNFKSREKTIHLSNGVDIWKKFSPELFTEEDRQSLRRDLGLNEKDIIFSFIGRMVREKGVFELISAFKRVSKRHSNVKLLLIGGLPESERDLCSYQQLLKDLDYPSIKHLGFRTDTPELLSISDCFVLPSHREGLPRSIIEAMGMRKPIIASNIRGCREEVFQKENGFLFEKGNDKELEIMIERIVEDSEARESFGKRSREIVEQFFDEEKVLQKQINLFKTL
ncbi:Glycosyltransferase involved in cell wall bisynthesis [Edaphobacillus lindanitolerans]|uniref:Glycosyltransferase involved in cell wall bisynthesis n=2 Tax=Edaphobacillus lindanitolerans TaxID=550447 RepID=A0A1U7PL23_9BACI|nr:Glycosyltransferase involved in cell wall bisynthesis [Edaphobacillus lindanitolerans]